MYLVFTRMPGESYRRRLKSLLLYFCYVFRALIVLLIPFSCHGVSVRCTSSRSARVAELPRAFCCPRANV